MDFLMNFLISSAWGQAPAAGAQPAAGGYSFLIMVVGFGALMYFMLIRPQSKRQKEHARMIEGLAKDDEVVTSGGLLGKIMAVGEQFVTVEFAQGVVMKVQKSTISMVMPKGTMKNS